MLRVQTHAPSGEDRSVGRSMGRSGLVVVALFVAGWLLGLGDLPARPAHGAPSSDVTALATAFGEITEGLARYLAAIAMADNKPLYLSDTWGRTTGSTDSDHSAARTDSWACDVAVAGIQVPTPQTELAARRVGAALGEQ